MWCQGSLTLDFLACLLCSAATTHATKHGSEQCVPRCWSWWQTLSRRSSECLWNVSFAPLLVSTFLRVAHHRRDISVASGLGELHGLPFVTETALGWCGCLVGLIAQGPQCPGSCPSTWCWGVFWDLLCGSDLVSWRDVGTLATFCRHKAAWGVLLPCNLPPGM